MIFYQIKHLYDFINVPKSTEFLIKYINYFEYKLYMYHYFANKYSILVFSFFFFFSTILITQTNIFIDDIISKHRVHNNRKRYFLL